MVAKQKRKIMVPVIITIILLTAAFVFFNRQNDTYNGKPISKTGFLLGTIVEVKIYEQVDEKVFDEVFNILNDIENKMSINIETSEVSKINKNAGVNSVKVSEETFHVIDKGKYYSAISDGFFDISIGPVVKLWGIGTENPQIPSNEQLKDSLGKVDYRNIELDSSNHSVKLTKKGMIVDLGGIAKGYAADRIAEYLRSNNIDSAIINLGGNVYALGAKPNSSPWKIGIQDPVKPRGTYLGILEVKSKSVVSSGVYERYFEHNGKRYHHILNPFTGYPVENSLMSITIVSDKSIDGDGLSTAVFSLGLKKGFELIDSLKGIEAIFIDKNKKVYITRGLKNKFELTSNEYTLNILTDSKEVGQ
jgi:thiamine biosynthesis lipoprotein